VEQCYFAPETGVCPCLAALKPPNRPETTAVGLHYEAIFMRKSKQKRNKRAKRRKDARSVQENQLPRVRKIFVSIFFYAWKLVVAISVFVAIYGYFSFRVSLSPYAPIDVSDPYSIPFIITNDSHLAIYDVEFACVIHKAEINTNIYTNIMIAYTPQIKVLDAKETSNKTVCKIKLDVPVEGITKIDMSIKVRFHPHFYPLHKEQEFRFVIQNINGVLHWMPKAKSEE